MEVNKKVTQVGKVRSSGQDLFYKKLLFKLIVKLKEKTTCNGDDLNNVAENH